jgi:hypothetical protein
MSDFRGWMSIIDFMPFLPSIITVKKQHTFIEILSYSSSVVLVIGRAILGLLQMRQHRTKHIGTALEAASVLESPTESFVASDTRRPNFWLHTVLKPWQSALCFADVWASAFPSRLFCQHMVQYSSGMIFFFSAFLYRCFWLTTLATRLAVGFSGVSYPCSSYGA